MTDVVQGPLIWVALVLFFSGLIYQGVQFFRLTARKDPVSLGPQIGGDARKKGFIERMTDGFRSLRRTVWYTHTPVMVVTSIFHFCLIVIPFFVLAHNILLDEYWGFSFWSFPERATDVLTLIVLFCGIFFLLRRIFLARVRAITTGYDYLILLIAVAPFLTGYLAYHQWFDYETMITLHILAGEAMLAAIPFTKLGHMLFFFLYRFLIGSEYSFSQGSRTW
jgi:nitrate reductase gamma subunit